MARSVRRFKETMEMRSTFWHRLRSHRVFAVAVIGLAVLAAACVHVWQRVMVIELAKEVATLRRENQSVVDDFKKVQADIVALSMLSRIEQYAADSLGLRPISADRLLTLVRESEKDIPPGELEAMFSSIKRVADYLPVLTEAHASARDLRPIKFDTCRSEEAGW